MEDDFEGLGDTGAGFEDQLNSKAFDPEDLAEGMKAFVEKLASHEGAEIPKGSLRKLQSLITLMGAGVTCVF